MALFRRFILSVLFVLLLAANLAHAQCNFALELQIKEKTSGQPLPNASVTLQPNHAHFSSHKNGNPVLLSLCKGVTYTLSVSFVGYSPKQILFSIDTIPQGKLAISLAPDNQLLNSVTVATQRPSGQLSDQVSVLENEKLEELRGVSLGEMLKTLSGVSAIQTGPSIFKPVIHGLYGSRVAVQQNGVRQEGQQWGMEHAPEIDPFTASRISVVKGAGSVRYGSDAPGGIVLVEPPPLPSDNGIAGEAHTAGISNGRMGIAALRLEGKHSKFPAWAWRVQGSTRRGGNVKTPKYFLDNTGLSETAFSANLGHSAGRWRSELFFSGFFTRLGIFSGSHIGNTTDLAQALSRPDSTFNYKFSYKINRPYQKIAHYLLKAKTSYLSENYGKFSLQMSQQSNERMEYDLHKPRGVSASYNRPELSFFLSTLHSELLWESPLIDSAWSLVAGISGQQQKNTTQGRFLIPDFTGTVLGGFFTATWQRGAWEAELGLRYDWRWLNTTQNKGRADSSLFFNRWASAAGLSYRVNSSLKIGAQLASTWRAPSVNELYSNGVHHGTASFEVGKASMKSENAYNGSVSLQWKSHELSAELGAYVNYIDNFIYLQPQAPVTVLTVRGTFPLFNYTQANVLMRGIDWSSELHITERWHWSAKTSLVRSYNITDDEYLIFTPADRLQSAISYHLPNSIRRSQTSFNVNVTRVGKQTRTPANGDYAPAPSGYVLFGLGAGSQWLVDDKHHLHVNISVDNLLNTAYRDYLNRFRYFAYDVGRSVSLRLRYEF